MKPTPAFAQQMAGLEWWRTPGGAPHSRVVSGTLCAAALVLASALAVLACRQRERGARFLAALGAAAMCLFAFMHALDASAPAGPTAPIQLGAALVGLVTSLIFAFRVPRMLALPTLNQVRAMGEERDRVLGDLRATEGQVARLTQLESVVKTQTRELRASQARLLAFIRHASTAISFKDLDGRFVLINPSYEKLIGHSEAELLGRTPEEVFPPETCRNWQERDRQALKRREGFQIEEEWSRDGGPTRFLLTHKFPVIGSDDQALGVGTIITDITERREAEQSHFQDQKLESLGILAGGLAHDFNNLLGAMEGNVELARMVAPPTGPVHPFLETLEGLITRSSGLVQQLLAYAGRGTTVVTFMDLNSQVEEITRLLRASLSRKAILRLDPGPGPLRIKGDPAQIQQVIMNLVLNAAEAVAPPDGVISIRTGRETLDAAAFQRGFAGQALEPGPYVFLDVADDGSGMAPEVLERIFDPFYTTKFAGRGLGLSAVLGTLRAHQGGILVRSEPGKGTCFRLLFPPAAGTGLPEPAEEPPFEEAIDTFQGSGVALVVDDEEPIRATAVRALQHLGFETLEAGDGVEALQVFEANRERIRIILMDLTMPRMDGEEAYRTLRGHGMLTPVILTSGFCARDVLDHFKGKGIAGFLQKPYRLKELAQEVGRALGRERPSIRAGESRLAMVAPHDLDMGCPMLDQQHRRLIGAFNQLAESLSPGGQRKEREKALEGLTEVALTHFGVEETLMESLAYPRTREHQASHVRLINQLNLVSTRVSQGTLAFSPALLDYLESWMVHHSQDEDKRLAQFLKSRGH